MSTAIKQTYEEKIAAIDAWEKQFKPANLAEDVYNRDLIANFLEQKYGNFVNTASLRDAVESLRDQLHWLAQPQAPVVKKGTAKDRLYLAGVEASPWASVAEQQAGSQRVEDKEQAFLTKCHLIRQQAELQEELSEVNRIVVQHPKLGVIWHTKTAEAKAKALVPVKAKIATHNAKCLNSGNEILTISI